MVAAGVRIERAPLAVVPLPGDGAGNLFGDLFAAILCGAALGRDCVGTFGDALANVGIDDVTPAIGILDADQGGAVAVVADPFDRLAGPQVERLVRAVQGQLGNGQFGGADAVIGGTLGMHLIPLTDLVSRSRAIAVAPAPSLYSSSSLIGSVQTTL